MQHNDLISQKLLDALSYKGINDITDATLLAFNGPNGHIFG